MSIICSMRGLSLIDIDPIWLISLVYLLMSFLRSYWLPKLHEGPYKSRLIANSSSFTNTELSIILTSCLTAIKTHVIKYCETVFERNDKNQFWSSKNLGEILIKLKSKGFLTSSVSTYEIYTLRIDF